MRRDDGSDIDIAFHEAHLTLRDGTPVLIRRLVTEDALSRFYKPRESRGSSAALLRTHALCEPHELLDKLVHYDPACAKAFYPQSEFVLPYRSTQEGVVNARHPPLKETHPVF
jgi:hypothetical protein